MALVNGKWFRNLFVQQTLTGTVNGSNTVFTTSNPPIFTSAILVFINGVYMIPGVHYSVSGNTVTFTNPPQPGQILAAAYIRSF